VARGAVALTALSSAGTTLWTHDVITGVAWSATATLTVLPSAGGAIVVWHGLHGGQDATMATSIDADGKVRDEPFSVGAATCATDTELVWAERGTKGTWLVKARAYGTATSVTALALPEERDPLVLCAAHRILALGDGDEDVTLTSWSQGIRTPPIRVMEDIEFPGDEERGHEVYAVGDVLGLVRIGQSGSVASREVTGDHRPLWRRFGRKLTEGDDVTLVDADAHTAILAFTRDTSAPGDVISKSTVHALAWDRAGSRDVTVELAPADPAHVRGPFWSGAVAGGVVVAWAERSVGNDAGEAPIDGLAYRVVSMDTPGELVRIARAADELVDAGCDEVHCYAVALARATGEDGGQPEVAEVLRYP